MRIFILTMEDPVYTIPFIKRIIEQKRENIVAIATSKGNRLTIKKNKSKLIYIVSLLLIMGIPFFLKNSFKTFSYHTKKYLAKFKITSNPSIISYAKNLGIEAFHINSPNSKAFIDYLRKIKPDIIINQSQSILKSEFLSIPSIGTLNRHNALLPKNRGRLTPFWVLYKKERETGVSIHFVEEGIDSGKIILQEKYLVNDKDSFRSVVKKNYEIAPRLMIQALDLLETGFSDFIPNDNRHATYNTTPCFKEAWKYRRTRFLKKVL